MKKPRTRTLTLLKRVVYIIVVSLFAWLWWVFLFPNWDQLNEGLYSQRKQEQKFGFTTDTPFVRDGTRHREVFTIYPTEGGFMEKAGFQDGDIVLTGDIYKLLDDFRGKTVSIRVVDGGDGAPYEGERH